MNEISVKELAIKTREAMRASGTAEYSLWKQYTHNLLPVVRWFRRQGHEMFSEEVAYLYLNELTKRFDSGEIKRDYYLFMRRGAARMLETFGCRTPEWASPKRGSRYQFNEFYEKLLADFSGSENFNKNTLGDIVWVARKFFAWLCEGGYLDLINVGADEIQKFVIECSNTMKINSVHNVKLYLRKLCAYLHNRGLLSNSYESLLGFRVSRQAKQFPTTPPEEIEAVLSLIDRDTTKGKRDYAMFMLAIVTGLRAVDIMRLKLTDVDWRKGEINIIQSKTGQNLQLPLTADVGEALQDYILNGRQLSLEPQIFLRCKQPYRPFADAVTIGDVYDEYREMAGYERKAFDGKGFHSLRRTVGTNLVTSDIPLADAAQLLGKIRPESMKKYVALDIPHLKECALSFTDIETEATA
jgi:integrase